LEGLAKGGGGLDGPQATGVAGGRRPGQGRRRRTSAGQPVETTPAPRWPRAAWLTAPGGTPAALERPGGSGNPGCPLREGGFTVMLGQAQHEKPGPGRKPAVKDWAWLAALVALGRWRARSPGVLERLSPRTLFALSGELQYANGLLIRTLKSKG